MPGLEFQPASVAGPGSPICPCLILATRLSDSLCDSGNNHSGYYFSDTCLFTEIISRRISQRIRCSDVTLVHFPLFPQRFRALFSISRITSFHLLVLNYGEGVVPQSPINDDFWHLSFQNGISTDAPSRRTWHSCSCFPHERTAGIEEISRCVIV